MSDHKGDDDYLFAAHIVRNGDYSSRDWNKLIELIVKVYQSCKWDEKKDRLVFKLTASTSFNLIVAIYGSSCTFFNDFGPTSALGYGGITWSKKLISIVAAISDYLYKQVDKTIELTFTDVGEIFGDLRLIAQVACLVAKNESQEV